MHYKPHGHHVLLLSVVAFLIALWGCTTGNTTPFSFDSYDYARGSMELGVAFPPNGDPEQRAFTTDHLRVLNVSRIRISQRWTHRQPEADTFSWAPLEQRLAHFSAAGVTVMITLEMKEFPAWTEPLSDAMLVERFGGFVSEMLGLYGAQISVIQFGNEWNWEIERYLGGNDDLYIDLANVLYDEVQQLPEDERPEVALGSISIGGLHGLGLVTGRIENVEFPGGRLYSDSEIADALSQSEVFRARIERMFSEIEYDLVDLHFYDDHWNWNAYVESVRQVLTSVGREPGSTPIIASEFGGPHPDLEPSSGSYQADRVHSYVKALDSLGIRESYFFKLVAGTDTTIAHPNSWLIDHSLKPNLTYEILRRYGLEAP